MSRQMFKGSDASKSGTSSQNKEEETQNDNKQEKIPPEDVKPKKHVVLSDDTKKSIIELKSKKHTYPGKNVSRETIDQDHSTRRSLDISGITIMSERETMVSHALKEIVSENIIAGPRGALLPKARASVLSIESNISTFTITTHTDRSVLRRTTLEGIDIPVDFEDAIAETGHGCFQYKLMALCGFIYSCCSLSTTTLSFVLPAAEYDFQLTSFDKGLLNTAPLIGMVIGAYMWGNLADSRGRRFVLLYSLMIDSLAAFISSLCQQYSTFFTFRIFNGLGIIGATSMVFAYLGEFVEYHRRDRYLSRLELFWTFGLISLPVIGFAILPRDWSFGSSDTLLWNSWRMFVFACGIPSLLAAILISRMPESPRFLLLQGKSEKTRQVLVKMFVSNTKKRPEEYPVKVIDLSSDAYYFPKMHGASCWVKFKRLCQGLVKQHQDLFHGRSCLNIFVTCIIDFGLMFVYYTVMLWIPELLSRQEYYLANTKKNAATLCEVSEALLEQPESGGKVDDATFFHTFIVCLACLPTNFMLLLVISYVSKKSLLVIMMLVAAGATAAVFFMDTVFKVTTMLCLFEAFATLVETVLFCAIVEIFPLSTRGTALSLTVTLGRLGAVLGNISFGLLIDNHCNLLFFGMSGILITSGLSSLLLPEMQIGHGS